MSAPCPILLNVKHRIVSACLHWLASWDETEGPLRPTGGMVGLILVPVCHDQTTMFFARSDLSVVVASPMAWDLHVGWSVVRVSWCKNESRREYSSMMDGHVRNDILAPRRGVRESVERW